MNDHIETEWHSENAKRYEWILKNPTLAALFLFEATNPDTYYSRAPTALQVAQHITARIEEAIITGDKDE